MPSRLEELRAQARSVSPAGSDRTRVGVTDQVVLYLYPKAELPRLPYKLRFTLSPDEWDTRVQELLAWTSSSAKPLSEAIYFFIFCIAIPAVIGYPMYLNVLDIATEDANGKRRPATPTDEMDAIIIPTALAIFLFIFFLVPLFVRKWILRKRIRRVLRGWASEDERRQGKNAGEIQWRVRLPRVFGSACAVRIPVPPRMMEEDTVSEMTLHSRNNSWDDVQAQALGGAGLARSDSIGSRSMFDGEGEQRV